jgi:hypothetical protein
MATNAPVRPRPAPPREVAPKAHDDRNDAPSRAVHKHGDWRETARRMWLWPIAILLSVPIGGFIADLVINGVDSVGTALAGGLIAGAVIGAAGWFVLRQRVSWLWIPATMVGMAVGLAVGAALVDYGIAGAFWWAVVNPLAWALGWLVTSYVITTNVEEHFAVFGASGAIVFGVLTWLLLAVLFRGTTAKVEVRQAAAAR